MAVCKLLILRERKSFFCCDPRYDPFGAVTRTDENYAASGRFILRVDISKSLIGIEFGVGRIDPEEMSVLYVHRTGPSR